MILLLIPLGTKIAESTKKHNQGAEVIAGLHFPHRRESHYESCFVMKKQEQSTEDCLVPDSHRDTRNDDTTGFWHDGCMPQTKERGVE